MSGNEKLAIFLNRPLLKTTEPRPTTEPTEHSTELPVLNKTITTGPPALTSTTEEMHLSSTMSPPLSPISSPDSLGYDFGVPSPDSDISYGSPIEIPLGSPSYNPDTKITTWTPGTPDIAEDLPPRSPSASDGPPPENSLDIPDIPNSGTFLVINSFENGTFQASTSQNPVTLPEAPPFPAPIPDLKDEESQVSLSEQNDHIYANISLSSTPTDESFTSIEYHTTSMIMPTSAGPTPGVPPGMNVGHPTSSTPARNIPHGVQQRPVVNIKDLVRLTCAIITMVAQLIIVLTHL